MKRTVLVGLVAAVMACGPAPAQTPAEAQADAVQARIIAAWAAREKQFARVRVRWTEERVTHPAAYSLEGAPVATGKLPTADLKAVFECRLVLDRTSHRLDVSGQTWSMSAGSLVKVDEVSVLTDTASQSITRQQDLPHAIVHISDPKTSTAHLNAEASRLIPYFRPSLLGRAACPPLELCEPTGRVVPVGGVPCHELVQGLKSSSTRNSLYVSAVSDHLLRRHDIQSGSRLTCRTDWSYAPHEQLGSVIAAWTEVLIQNDGQPVRTSRCAVNAINLVPDAEDMSADFDPMYPPNSRVADDRNGKLVRYIVDGTGQVGPKVTDRSVRFSDMTTADGTAVSRFDRRILIVPAVGVVLVSLLLLRRQHRNRGMT